MVRKSVFATKSCFDVVQTVLQIFYAAWEKVDDVLDAVTAKATNLVGPKVEARIHTPQGTTLEGTKVDEAPDKLQQKFRMPYQLAVFYQPSLHRDSGFSADNQAKVYHRREHFEYLNFIEQPITPLLSSETGFLSLPSQRSVVQPASEGEVANAIQNLHNH
nr:unnamed protein product [Spirometra erinaceieuropaei]